METIVGVRSTGRRSVASVSSHRHSRNSARCPTDLTVHRFTARCYAERGIAAESRPSVRDVEVLWSYSLGSFEINYIYSRVRLGNRQRSSLLTDPKHYQFSQMGTSLNSRAGRSGYGKVAVQSTKPVISLKRRKAKVTTHYLYKVVHEISVAATMQDF